MQFEYIHACARFTVMWNSLRLIPTCRVNLTMLWELLGCRIKYILNITVPREVSVID